MCRIAGLIDYNSESSYNIENILVAMRDTMIKGGPDAYGIYIDSNTGLAHRRLSIIDLSTQGNQPIHWEKWTIVFNGEIYNYKDIRVDLEKLGYNFDTNTDTEVIIKAYNEWGIKAISKFSGMFSFALYDKQEKKLILCRDRLGVKPLYWYFHNNLFLFSSEIKAFHKHPNFDKSIDLSSIPHFLKKGYFNSEQCIFKYVHKLMPGSLLVIDSDMNIKMTNYWNIQEIYNSSKIDKRNEEHIINELEVLLNKSFNLRMVSDVDVGIFLSGGIDSSLVASILQNNSKKKIETFTLGFDNKIYNESVVAKNIAKQIGTNHNE